jgi:G patch domain/KOW motif-containing protein
MGGDVKESLYGGFMESFDPAAHHVSAAAVRSRLEGSTRDADGRFRVTVGSSTLRAREEDPNAEKGISLAALEKQVLAEKLEKRARKAGKHSATPGGDAAGEEQTAKRQKTEEVPPRCLWVRPGLVVKVIARDPPELYKAKGTVVRIVNDDSAELEFDGSAATVRRAMPVSALETVIPKPGGTVAVVGGAHDGARGTLVDVDVDAFCARVQLQSSAEIVLLPYEHVCKQSK